MKRTLIAALFASSCLLAAAAPQVRAADAAIKIVPDAIGGTVTSPKGPEAGVWVIAKTGDLPNPFVKIVVTDDKGRYVLPQLPKAKYQVWVRGYGLIDSDPVDATPGNSVDLTAKIAPSAKEAAEYYPPNYWYALLEPPAASEFPGTGPGGNGIGTTMHIQQDWLAHMKENCLFCHQFGDKATRTLVSTGGNSTEGWAQRIQMARGDGDVVVGNHAREFAQMQNNMSRYGRERGLKMFASWSDKIAAGELPPESPPRPQGQERNVVVTLWDWADGHFIHDEATTDKRNPTVNANGPIYGTDTLNGHLALLDPNTGKSTLVDVPGSSPVSPHDQNGQVHNPMMDGKGRVWMSMRAGEGKSPSWCTDGGENPYAKYFPMEEKEGKQISVYDPATKQITLIPVCFDTHHVNIGHTADNIMYFSGDFNAFGWINTRVWDETHDAKKSIGWCPFVLDTSGDGKIDPDRSHWNEPGDAIAAAGGAEGTVGRAKPDGTAAGGHVFDPKADTRINGFPYSMNVSPVDDSIWVAKYTPAVPSGLIRLTLGKNPPETCKTEYYEPPKQPDGSFAAFNMRGVDLDSKGIAWVAFGSGELGRFDRSKCAVTSGPTANGQQCPAGWTFFDTPGPKVTGVKIGSADWHYLTWVDLHNVFGLGKDVPIIPGSNSDSLIAFLPDTKKFVVMRVPYPMGYYPRGLDARIDDPNTGWKGKAIWSDNSETALWHQETGEGSYGKVVKFQLRPNPLAD